MSHVAVQFPLYEKAKSIAASLHDSTDNASLTPSAILVCSSLSKMVASIVTYPHEVLRTRLQIKKTSIAAARAQGATRQWYSPLVTGSNPPPPSSMGDAATHPAVQRGVYGWNRKGGIIDTFLKIKRQDGWRGFYRGLSINLVRTVPNSAVTMLT